ncbi:MAG: ABC transporter ATP-binding protein [Euryarchaeota archaeon]|nr:ABC transporter ATP-binding protein [Euryarchaeota archaeon]MBU4032157.1 ABC transporter ATP-binding protein [Candidatus Thermoplasmatota archaeon]MBU4072293.1 ABC transporter ATP-binding protein [Candidatus Thermoplasmatota archaeon]MBU4143859.1 ABC transporter ATP-binding protein [Candidatus Thermoplasmatota archaeon]
MKIIVKDVWKSYDGSRNVLRNVNLEIPPREMVLIKGRSGSGKSTLLNLIGCIDVPTKGEIQLNGYATAALSDKELANIRLHKIGIIFQAHNLINDLTVYENVLLPMKIAKWHDGDWRVKELLHSFGLDSYAEKFPDEISGGERQRVAVARALANSPAVLLADEPTASLDIDNCDIVIDAFKKANREFGATVVIASHDPAVEEHVGTKYTLERGELRGEING